ncbi:hypothetical protein [Streptomyces eurythermus]
MKMPRVKSETCGRKIAAGIVAGRPTKGRLWRHDPTEQASEFGNVLVSCTGSLAIVDLLVPGEQLAIQLGLDDDGEDGQVERGLDTIALF